MERPESSVAGVPSAPALARSRRPVALLLAAGFGTRWESDLAALLSSSSPSPRVAHLTSLVGLPKPLLPVHDTPVLQHWVSAFERAHVDTVIVSNAAHVAHYREWAARVGYPSERILVDGVQRVEDRLGAMGDVQFAVDALSLDTDIFVVSTDVLFEFASLSVDDWVARCLAADDGDSVVAYPLHSEAELSRRAVLDLEPSGVVRRFLEKPGASAATEITERPFVGAAAVYFLRRSSVPFVRAYLRDTRELPLAKRDAPGQFFQWWCNVRGERLYAHRVSNKIDTDSVDALCNAAALLARPPWAGARTLAEAGVHVLPLAPHVHRDACSDARPALGRAFARTGVVGNLSDNFGGIEITMATSVWYAEVAALPPTVGYGGRRLQLLPHPRFDSQAFDSLPELTERSDKRGYGGGIRLLHAACHKFYGLVASRGLARLDQLPGVVLRYTTSIPLQVGLAGSSALIVATFRALLRYHGWTMERLSAGDLDEMATHVLRVERDLLGIAGGLHDRFAQLHEGLIYCDVTDYPETDRGRTERMDHRQLPPFYYVHSHIPKLSGGPIGTMKTRFAARDPDFLAEIAALRGTTLEARALIESGKLVGGADGGADEQALRRFCEIVELNYEARRRLYTGGLFRPDYGEMHAIAERHGLAGQFPGSGGALILVQWPGHGRTDIDAAARAFAAAGFSFGPLPVQLPQGNE